MLAANPTASLYQRQYQWAVAISRMATSAQKDATRSVVAVAWTGGEYITAHDTLEAIALPRLQRMPKPTHTDFLSVVVIYTMGDTL
jgi:hypothetical protein